MSETRSRKPRVSMVSRRPLPKVQGQDARLQAMLQAARYHGIELDPNEFRHTPGEAPTAAALSLWAQNAGMWSRAVRIRWRHLLALRR